MNSDISGTASGVLVIELWPHETECVLCGAFLYFRDAKGLPMYESEVVSDDWDGPWAGFSVCDECYAKHRGKA